MQRKDRSWTGGELSFPVMFLKKQDNPWFQGYAGVMSPVGVVFSAPSHSDAQRCPLLDHTSLWSS